MRQRSMFGLIGAMALLLLCKSVSAYELMVTTEEGERFAFECAPEQTLEELQETVGVLLGESAGEYVVELTSSDFPRKMGVHVSRSQGKYLGHPRPYYQEVTTKQKEDVRFIITSLANKSLVSIAMMKKELEAAGTRIDPLHPLRFLMAIFTDEELKAALRNVRGKGWVWNHFVGGLKECLSTEAHVGNMGEDVVGHFSRVVGINPRLIWPSIAHEQWDTLLDQLITHIPRKGDHNRYDCMLYP